MRSPIILALLACGCSTASVLRQEADASLRAGRAGEAIATVDAARGLDAAIPDPRTDPTFRAGLIAEERGRAEALTKEGKADEGWRRLRALRGFLPWAPNELAEIDTAIARQYDVLVLAKMPEAIGVSATDPDLALMRLAALAAVPRPAGAPTAGVLRLQEAARATVAPLQQQAREAEQKFQRTRAFDLLAPAASLVGSLVPELVSERDRLRFAAAEKHASRLPELARYPAAAFVHAQLAEDLAPEHPLQVPGPLGHPIPLDLPATCPADRTVTDQTWDGRRATYTVHLTRCEPSENAVHVTGTRKGVEKQDVARRTNDMSGKAYTEWSTNYVEVEIPTYTTRRIAHFDVEGSVTVRVGEVEHSGPIDLHLEAATEETSDSGFPPSAPAPDSAALAHDAAMKFSFALSRTHDEALAIELEKEAFAAAGEHRLEALEDAYATMLVQLPLQSFTPAEEWFREIYGTSADTLKKVIRDRWNPDAPRLTALERAARTVEPAFADATGPYALPPEAEIPGMLDGRKKHFALRGGYGSQLGIRGVGLEIRPTGRNIGISAGTGTYLLSGGLSFNTGELAETSAYLDLHATWVRQGLLSGPVGSGFGYGATVGFDLRPVSWLSLKMGGGLAHNSAARDTGKWRVLVWDLSAGLVF